MSPLEADLNDAIADVIQRHEAGGVVTKWVALVESIDPEGGTGMWTLTSEGVKTWDVDGMLSYALSLQHAKTIAEAVRMGDD